MKRICMSVAVAALLLGSALANAAEPCQIKVFGERETPEKNGFRYSYKVYSDCSKDVARAINIDAPEELAKWTEKEGTAKNIGTKDKPVYVQFLDASGNPQPIERDSFATGPIEMDVNLRITGPYQKEHLPQPSISYEPE